MWDLACWLGARLAGWDEIDYPIIISVIILVVAGTLHSTKILNMLYKLVHLPIEHKFGLKRGVTRWSLIRDIVREPLSPCTLNALVAHEQQRKSE